MKHKLSKGKRIIITAMAVMCALSTAAAIGANAKTYQWTHTVSLATNPGAMTSIITSMGGTGKMSENFGSYPTIFDGYSTSNNSARAVNEKTGKSYGWKNFTLTKNYPAVIAVTYGQSMPADPYYVQYKNLSNGGFRVSATLLRTY